MAENIGSLAVSLSLDASNFNGSLSSVDRSLKTMGSELKAVKAKGADYGRSLDGLSKKQDILKRSLDTSNVKLTETRKKYDEMVSSGKATEAQLERQAKKVNDAQAEYNKLQTELGQVEADLRSLSSTLGKQEEAWTKLSKKVDAAADKMQVSGEKMRSIGRNMTTYMTTPLVAMGVAAAKTGMDFEAQMSRVGAISQATGKELGQLNKQALELGASTSKSASEVALGMENLAAMGFEVNEIIGAMPGVIAAAEASGEDMALTADVMAAAINAFGLEASDASHVADVLAQAANQSAADINDMGYAFKYAAPVAKMLGISLEELAAATGIMTDSGLAGEQAGTALRSALLRLSDPPKAAANELKRLGIISQMLAGTCYPFPISSVSWAKKPMEWQMHKKRQLFLQSLERKPFRACWQLLRQGRKS